MPRFNSELDRQEHLVVSIKSLAMQATTLAVDTVIEAGRAGLTGDSFAVAAPCRRLAAGAGVATGEIAWLAKELDASSAGDSLIAAAGTAITGLQSSLLSIAGAVQELAQEGDVEEIYISADALRTAALQLDELLPAYQPS